MFMYGQQMCVDRDPLAMNSDWRIICLFMNCLRFVPVGRGGKIEIFNEVDLLELLLLIFD